jgi:ribosomal protein S18 acetylase RimI-like enzyme
MEKRIKLHKALVDQLLFAMEDQGKQYAFSLSGKTVHVHSGDWDESEYIPIPPWSSSDGYRMRGNYILSLNNPLVKEELSVIQESGQGVFRKFKGYLRNNPGLYRNWLRFKRRFMLAVIQQWAREWEQYFEVADLDDPAEELDDLVQTDFDFGHRHDTPCPPELWASFSQGIGSWVPAPPPESLGYLGWCRSIEGKEIGWIWAQTPGDYSSAILWLWWVDEKFRSMGIGQKLLHEMEEFLQDQSTKEIFLPDWTSHWGDKKKAAREGYLESAKIFRKSLS